MESFSFTDFLGVLGVVGYLSSYAILQLKTEFAETLIYSVLNFLSASLVLISLIDNFNFSSMLIQISWILISSFGMYRCFQTKVKNIDQSKVKLSFDFLDPETNKIT